MTNLPSPSSPPRLQHPQQASVQLPEVTACEQQRNVSVQSLADTVDGLLQSEREERNTKGKSGKEEPTHRVSNWEQQRPSFTVFAGGALKPGAGWMCLRDPPLDTPQILREITKGCKTN